tara:strand:+ start:1558 stop:1863 length:306 start_codon:yes stop_codon:yes gene_type:complete
MKIKSSKNRVQDALIRFPHLRDDDNKLLATIWYRELQQMKFNTLSNTLAFLKLLSEGKLSNAESIRRCRAKLQELHPNLRGNAYLERHKETEEVQKDLREF